MSEKDGRADALSGIVSRRKELKTGIASAITSNISPTPPYEIRLVAFCHSVLTTMSETANPVTCAIQPNAPAKSLQQLAW